MISNNDRFVCSRARSILRVWFSMLLKTFLGIQVLLEVQQNTFRNLGKDRYLRLPKAGTNPRGVEINKDALSRLIRDKGTKSIEIKWQRSKIDYEPYQRWLDHWQREDLNHNGKEVQTRFQ